VAQKILSQRARSEDAALADIPQVAPQPDRTTDPKGISVRGVDGVLTRLAKCCNPVIGEPIVGFVTRGKGITVHRADCRQVINERDRARLVTALDKGVEIRAMRHRRRRRPYAMRLCVDLVQLMATRERRPSNARQRGKRADSPHCSRRRGSTTGAPVRRPGTGTIAGCFMSAYCMRRHSPAPVPD